MSETSYIDVLAFVSEKKQYYYYFKFHKKKENEYIYMYLYSYSYSYSYAFVGQASNAKFQRWYMYIIWDGGSGLAEDDGWCLFISWFLLFDSILFLFYISLSSNNTYIHTYIHRLRYSHSWGLPHECIRIGIRIHIKIFVFFFFYEFFKKIKQIKNWFFSESKWAASSMRGSLSMLLTPSPPSTSYSQPEN